MKKTERTILGWMILLLGLVVMAFGVGFSIKANLGTSPISSLPYVTSILSGLTVGQTTILLHVVLIFLQILILRKNYNLIQLLQLPVALVFGFLCDLALSALSGVAPSGYLSQWLLCLIGILFVAIGVSCEVISGTVPLAGEGFVMALCKVIPVEFGYLKVGFDVFLVTVSILLCVIFLHSLVGVREGTVAAALMVGILSKELNRIYSKVYKRIKRISL